MGAIGTQLSYWPPNLCSLSGRYNNPTPTRLLAPIDCQFHTDRFRQPIYPGEPVRKSYSYSAPCPRQIVLKLQHRKVNKAKRIKDTENKPLRPHYLGVTRTPYHNEFCYSDPHTSESKDQIGIMAVAVYTCC
jgi:hypothetical protein